ncbi:MAG: helix-turn-helix domain-containing protein [Aliarcobacter sp.]|nr:helix-turn-helix domain-containing protein [Aliarcobacter sp.]
MFIDLSNLELIPQLLQELKELKQEISKITNINKPKLTTHTKVAKYLNVSVMTIYNMVDDGRLKENIHFKKQMLRNKVKIVFVESAIIKYKSENL